MPILPIKFQKNWSVEYVDHIVPISLKLQIVFSFGSSIRYAREKRDYTREQIADRAEISSRFLAAIENDKRKPSLDVLIRLVNAIGASFDEILAPQMERKSETIDRIQRLILQCSQRDQEILLALIDKMLDTREKQEKINAVGFLDPRPRLSLSVCIRANRFLL